MTTETELKLHIDSTDAGKLMSHPLLQSAIHIHAPQHLYNIYFDTPQQDLLQQGVGLRVRRIANKRLQTLKTAGSGLGGLHQRQEWEMEVNDDKPDYALFPKNALPKWCADEKNLKKIKPLFTTDFVRTSWDLNFEGSQIEVSLDQGEVKTDKSSTPLSEVELELKSGQPETLYQLALILQEDMPLRIENNSKAAQGYALHKPKLLQYYKAGAVKLKSDMTAEQAFVYIIWHSLEQLQANEEMVLYGEDIEGVHQMRVALRRLRSCLTLFQPLIPKQKHAKLRKQLKWITQILGVARDWDVFALSLQNLQSPEHKLSFPLILEKELEDLQITVSSEQKKAYTNVREALRSQNYSRMLLSLGFWLMEHSWRQKMEKTALQNLEQPAIEFANQILNQHLHSIKTQGQTLAQLELEALHELRIAIKQMAYGSRFFIELYPRELARPYTKTLSTLQDELGILNDGHVASDLLNKAGLSGNAPIRHFLNGWYAHQQVTRLASLELAWETFLEQKIFWKGDE
jgi:triphosphatase